MHEFAVRNVWTPKTWPNLKVIDVSVEDARYFGKPWLECSEYEKRKFENVLFLKSHDQEYRTKILFHDRTGRRVAETR